MREVNPHAEPRLADRVVEGYAEGMDFVRSLDVHTAEPVTVLGYGRGSLTDMANYLLACERLIRDRGELLVSASAERLIVDEGAVAGAELRTATGETREIRAAFTLLATGGFGGDPDLRAELIGPAARDLPLRANVHSVGDGLRLGRSAGAAVGPPNAGFYGHLIPSHVVYDDPYEFTDLTFYHSEHGLLINLDGRRFCDETVGDHLNTLHVLDQPEARALMITDQRVHDQWMLAPYVEGVEPLDKFQLAYKRGAYAAIAEDVDEFEYLPEEWGYPGEAVRDSVHAFNRQCAAGEPSPPRALDAAAARGPAVLRHRGHPGDHRDLDRPPDRRARPRAGWGGAPDRRPARRGIGCRRRVRSRVRRRPGERAGVRPRGGRDRPRRNGRDARGLSARTFRRARSAPRC